MKSLTEQLTSFSAAAQSNPLFKPAIVAAGGIVLLDQATKLAIVHLVKLPERLAPCAKAPGAMCRQIAVSPIFDLTYVENRGASFGMLAGGVASRVILSAVSFGVAVWLLGWLSRLDRTLAAAAVALIIGGAIGNLIDRAVYGYVVDFLDFSGLYFPWVFNVADAAINVGVGLLLLDAFVNRQEDAAS
ncbi:MAG: signal peptidase II [Pseudomonadota bacterium]